MVERIEHRERTPLYWIALGLGLMFCACHSKHGVNNNDTGPCQFAVDAGPAKTLNFPAKDLTLFGHVTAPQDPPRVVQWSMLSGPTTVVFSAPKGLTTTATFNAT